MKVISPERFNQMMPRIKKRKLRSAVSQVNYNLKKGHRKTLLRDSEVDGIQNELLEILTKSGWHVEYSKGCVFNSVTLSESV